MRLSTIPPSENWVSLNVELTAIGVGSNAMIPTLAMAYRMGMPVWHALPLSLLGCWSVVLLASKTASARQRKNRGS